GRQIGDPPPEVPQEQEAEADARETEAPQIVGAVDLDGAHPMAFQLRTERAELARPFSLRHASLSPAHHHLRPDVSWAGRARRRILGLDEAGLERDDAVFAPARAAVVSEDPVLEST